LVDLLSTVARSREIVQAAGVSERATAVGKALLTHCYRGPISHLLKSVLGDWPDAEVIKILNWCAEVAHPAVTL
jgi:hypothetical protein